MRWILNYSDLIGGLLGIAGSIILGYPFVSEMADRHYWDLLKKFKEQVLTPRSNDGLTADELEAYRQIRDRLIDARLGQHQQYLRITVAGFFLLIMGFIFMTLASCERAWPQRDARTGREAFLADQFQMAATCREPMILVRDKAEV